MLTVTPAAQAELNRLYRVAWYDVQGVLTAIGQILEEDYPAPDDVTAAPTRYDLDSVKALGWQLSALVEGWDEQAG